MRRVSFYAKSCERHARFDDCAVSIAAALLLSLILAAGWLWLLKNHTRKMVWGTIGLTVALQLGLAVLLFAVGNPSALFLLIMTALYCAIIYCISKCIAVARWRLAVLSCLHVQGTQSTFRPTCWSLL